MQAVINGEKKFVQLILERGADVNSKDDVGRTALIIAALYGNIKIIDILLAAGADITAQCDEGKSALMEFIENASVSEEDEDFLGFIRKLINAGAEDKSALRMAVEGQNKEVVKLVELGEIKMNKTALMTAIKNSDSSMVKLLLELGVNPILKSRKDNSALMEALFIGNNDVIKELIDGGKKLDWSHQGLSPLKICIQRNNITY